eukprot:TRINITY_DN11301_c0_g1_i8.p2 TRINITY_DN11301_c0_g1~~TRINITY_DN11301_c0_g1_i8.p2  ORF type:complete len:189 (-),score=8.03 TRINITY_DN11301_c0_g1_i8:827-1393(-)
MSSGKLFIGGLSWETTEDMLHAHYGAFGEISDVAIMKDRQTGKPRGFGFVSFVDPAVAEVVVNEKHTIDGRTVDTKLSVPREQMRPSHPGQRARQSQPQLDASFKKLFLGGLSARATEDSIATYFSRFGTVHEVLVMRDRNTGYISVDLVFMLPSLGFRCLSRIRILYLRGRTGCRECTSRVTETHDR